MSEREVFHVVHTQAEGWKVERAGSKTAITKTETKEEAVRAGRRLAEAAPLGQLVIHREDGSIEKEFTYGKDPRTSPG